MTYPTLVANVRNRLRNPRKCASYRLSPPVIFKATRIGSTSNFTIPPFYTIVMVSQQRFLRKPLFLGCRLNRRLLISWCLRLVDYGMNPKNQIEIELVNYHPSRIIQIREGKSWSAWLLECFFVFGPESAINFNRINYDTFLYDTNCWYANSYVCSGIVS